MKRFSFALAVLAGLTACQDSPLVTAPDAAPDDYVARSVVGNPVVASATGSGHRVRNDRALVFTFDALRRADGTGEGRYYLDWQDLGPALDHQRLKVTVDVTCISVRDDIAWVGGIITEVDGPLVREGTVSYFYVIDGGEGDGADRISLLRLNDQAGEDQLFCDEQPLALANAPVERGNVQVRSR